MEITQLTNAKEKQRVTKLVLEALPEWFGDSGSERRIHKRKR